MNVISSEETSRFICYIGIICLHAFYILNDQNDLPLSNKLCTFVLNIDILPIKR